MIDDIRKHLEAVPFEPFTINMADGREILVPTRDHIALAPARAVVTYDNNSMDVLSDLLMTGITKGIAVRSRARRRR